MGLKNYNRVLNGFKHSWIISSVFIAFVLIGCGGSEQATTNQQAPQEPVVQTAPTAETTQPKEQVKKEEAPMDNALSSFVGSDELKPDSGTSKQPVVVTSGNPTQLAQYEKQIGDLRTENTNVKQRNIKLEEDNRLLTARLNDTETKLAAEKDRADKAESGTKTVMPATEASASEIAAPGNYDDALKAFKAHKYDEALKGFQAVANSNDASEDVVGNAKYWIGETHFAKKNYKVALEDFQGILKLKNSTKKGDAQFMLGQTYERLGSKAKAKAAYEKVVKEYPMNKNVKRAKQRWAKL